MTGFMVEIVITAFAFGGILGAMIALHLSANLKQTKDTHKSALATIELPRTDESAEPGPVPVDIASHQAVNGKNTVIKSTRNHRTK